MRRSSSLFKDSEKIENRFNIFLDNIRYDAKFIFNKVGYMLEPSELGSAFGLVQLKKLKKTLNIRKRAAQRHINFFKKYSNWLELPEMNSKCKSFWFAFPLIVKDEAPLPEQIYKFFFRKKKYTN